MDLGLSDKVAVITGGSIGIGLAVARGFAAEGVHVALCARDAGRLAACADAIASEFGTRAATDGVSELDVLIGDDEDAVIKWLT